MAVSVLKTGLNCHDCQDNQKEERGCFKDSQIPGRWQIGNDTYQRCPIKLITQQSQEYIFAYKLFKEGILPNGNCWGNETMKFLMAMQTISSEVEKDGR